MNARDAIEVVRRALHRFDSSGLHGLAENADEALAVITAIVERAGEPVAVIRSAKEPYGTRFLPEEWDRLENLPNGTRLIAIHPPHPEPAMSDENVGGLVEKWRHEDPPHGYDCNCDRCKTFEQCASELEATLSAHGQPVVDAVSRALEKLAAEFDELADAAYQECEYGRRDVWRDAAHDCRNRSKRTEWITAALTGATP